MIFIIINEYRVVINIYFINCISTDSYFFSFFFSYIYFISFFFFFNKFNLSKFYLFGKDFQRQNFMFVSFNYSITSSTLCWMLLFIGSHCNSSNNRVWLSSASGTFSLFPFFSSWCRFSLLRILLFDTLCSV